MTANPADNYPEHHVALVLVASCRAIDAGDAELTAVHAVRQALTAAGSIDGQAVVVNGVFRMSGTEAAVPVRVADVMGMGHASKNGYLSIQPSAKLFWENR